jgi:hypothetical protein
MKAKFRYPTSSHMLSYNFLLVRIYIDIPTSSHTHASWPVLCMVPCWLKLRTVSGYITPSLLPALYPHHIHYSQGFFQKRVRHCSWRRCLVVSKSPTPRVMEKALPFVSKTNHHFVYGEPASHLQNHNLCDTWLYCTKMPPYFHCHGLPKFLFDRSMACLRRRRMGYKIPLSSLSSSLVYIYTFTMRVSKIAAAARNGESFLFSPKIQH